jgi:hypothetical protein
MAVLGGIVSSKEPWIRGAFIVMGVASVVCVVWEGRIMQPQATPAQIAAALSPLLGGKNTGIPTSAPARDIAAEIVKKLPVNRLTMAPVDSLMTVQANATSLINRLTETLITTYQDQAVWMSRLPSQPSTSGNLSVAQKHLNGIVTGFDETYQRQYQQEVKNIYRELMGHLITIPPPLHGLPRDIKYSDDTIATQGGPGQGEDKVHDLCLLLTEVEKENNLPSTCSIRTIFTKLTAAKRR